MTLRVFIDKIVDKLNPLYWIFPHHFKRVTLHKALDLADETEHIVKKIEKMTRRGKDPTKNIRRFEKDITEELHHLFEIVKVTVIEFDRAIQTINELEQGVHGKYYIKDREIVLELRKIINQSRGRFNELINRAMRINVYPYKPLPEMKTDKISKLQIHREQRKIIKQQEELRMKHEQLEAIKKNV